jgi:hypothetical protein
VNATRSHVGRGLGQPWPYPPEFEPVTNVPPLRGRQRLRRTLLTGGVLLLVLVPLVIAFLVQQLGL